MKNLLAITLVTLGTFLALFGGALSILPILDQYSIAMLATGIIAVITGVMVEAA